MIMVQKNTQGLNFYCLENSRHQELMRLFPVVT